VKRRELLYYPLMELRHFKYFVAVARNLNFTKAAEILHVSQPPLSRQIQEFEEEIGTALFDRRGKKTSLTEAGEYLLGETERLLEEIDVACRTAKAIAEKTRALNIGCVYFFLNARLTPFLEEVRRRDPELKIEILVMSTEAQEKALQSGAIEVGFVRSWIREAGLVFEPIAEESLSLIFSSALRLEGSPEECMAALESMPFIAMARSSAAGLSDSIAALCAEYGVSPSSAYECNDAFSIIELVSSGLGWSIVPDMELGDMDPAKVTCIRLPPKIIIGLCYKAVGLSDKARAFVGMAKEHFFWSP
jgi:DNA-binding transcriptional LysR family regulator